MRNEARLEPDANAVIIDGDDETTVEEEKAVCLLDTVIG